MAGRLALSKRERLSTSQEPFASLSGCTMGVHLGRERRSALSQGSLSQGAERDADVCESQSSGHLFAVVNGDGWRAGRAPCRLDDGLAVRSVGRFRSTYRSPLWSGVAPTMNRITRRVAVSAIWNAPNNCLAAQPRTRRRPRGARATAASS